MVLPILLYHGKENLKIPQISELIKLPNVGFQKFVPTFEMILIDISKIPESIYLKSTFLLFKHKGDNQALLEIAEEVFIFVEHKLNETEKRTFIKLYLHYLFLAFKLKRSEIIKVKQKIPPMIIQEFENSYDVAKAEGREEGI